MEVETFECQETITETPEISQEAIALIEQLGLTGQQLLVKPPEQETPAARCPYRHIRAEERFVYETLCPAKTSLAQFAECPIPLRVLQIAAHAQSLGLFKHLEVWSARGDLKDPVLVAYDGDRYNGRTHCFILARWAETMDAWPLLAERALKVWKERCRAKLAEIRANLSVDEASLDTVTLDKAASGRDEPCYYGISH